MSEITMLEGLFLAVAEAVFSYAIDKLELAEQIKRWLKSDPATLAFQKAISRAYTAFARQYPEFTASLFDKSFLAGKGAPELAKLLTRHLHPDPALFAQAWGTSIGFDVNSRFCKEATKPAADFLKWLEAELKAEPVFQPLFDSRALESLSHLESQIEKLTAELQRGLNDALRTANDYKEIVIEIGGDIRNSSVITGNSNQVTVTNIYNHYYSGAFATLNDYYISPQAVFQRVRVEEFVGRDWLTAKVDAFLNDSKRKSGTFLLIGEAGVGKTSFLAHLVKERRYLHLFADQAPGDASLQRALQSLGSQLVTRYQIDPYKDRDTLTQLAAFPDFLDKLLRLAANTLIKGEKIVIVCDALDEAGTFPDGYVFGLPNVLPDGVYFIFSQRPVNTKLPNLTPHIEKLEAQSGENLQDMEIYLRATTKRPEIEGQLRSKHYSDEIFVRTLKEKSLGVWMYLHYIIKEVESGSRAPLDLENLPTGLTGYYADFWDDWRYGRKGRGEGQKKWNEVYAPLLGTLAAAQEPVSIEKVVRWAEINTSPREIRHLFQEDWRAFISERTKNGESLYAPYHASFRDFLTGKANFTQLSPAQSNLVRDLAGQTQEAHKRIIKIFREECKDNFPQLVEQDYPRLHLTTHLTEAGEHQMLINLLTEGGEKITWAEARFQKEETYAGFLLDLGHLWEYAEQENDLALCVRCMLIENSIHSLATNIPPDLLVELAKSEIWSYARSLTIINQISKPSQQAEAIRLIAQHLPPYLHKEALFIAEKIESDEARADAITSLLPYLDDQTKLESLGTAALSVNKISDQYTRLIKFIDLIPYLSDDFRPEAIQSVLVALEHMRYEPRLTHILIKLIPFLSYDLKSKALQKMLDALGGMEPEREKSEFFTSLMPYLDSSHKTSIVRIAKEIKDVEHRASVLTKLIPYLGDDVKAEIMQQALTASQEIQQEYYRARALTSLTPHLSSDLKGKISEDILTIAQHLANEDPPDYFRDEYLENILLGLVPHLNEDLRPQAIAIAQAISMERSRTSIFIEIAPHLNDTHKSLVLAAIDEYENEHERVTALTDLLPHLSEGEKPQILQKTLSVIQALTSMIERSFALIGLLPHMSSDPKTETVKKILSTVREIKDEEIRTRALTDLLPYVSNGLLHDVLLEILAIKEIINDQEARSRTLISLMDFFSGDTKLEVQLEVLGIIQDIKDEYARAKILVDFLPYLNRNFESQTFAIALNIRYEEERAETLICLLPYLSKELNLQAQFEALAAAQNIRHELSKVNTLSDLIPHLTNELKLQALLTALDTVERFEEDLRAGMDYRESMLRTLAPHLNDETMPRALLIPQETSHDRERAQLLSALIPYLSDAFKPQALVVAQKITDHYHRATALINLLPFLSNDSKWQAIQDVLSASQKIESEIMLCRMLIELMPHLSDHLRQSIVDEILSARKIIAFEGSAVDILMSLTPYINLIHIPKVLAIANQVKNEYSRAKILTILIPLSQDVIPQALAAVQKIEDDNTRLQALLALFPYLNSNIKQESLNTILAINDAYYRSTTLIALLPHLNDALKQRVLPKALQSAQQIPWAEYRSNVLSTLLPHVNNDQKTLVLKELLDAIEKIEDRNKRVDELAKHSSWFEATAKARLLGDALLSANSEFVDTIINEWRKINFIGIEKIIHLILRKIAQTERSIGLAFLSKLLPVLEYVGRGQTHTEILRSIRDTARWWP